MDLPLLDDFPEADAADDPHLLPVGEDQGPGLFYGWREVDNSDLVWTAGGCSSLPCQRTPVGRVGEDLQDEVVDVLIAILGHHIQWRSRLLLSMTMMMMLSTPILLWRKLLM